MVRVNIIDPRKLADQHLVAEYAEILMLLAYVRRYPGKSNIPEMYTLGTGHMRFFKDKLKYLRRRHDSLRAEMKRRGFRPRRIVSLDGFPRSLKNDWRPGKADKEIIKARIMQRLRQKPGFYRYCGKNRSLKFLVGLVRSA